MNTLSFVQICVSHGRIGRLRSSAKRIRGIPSRTGLALAGRLEKDLNRRAFHGYFFPPNETLYPTPYIYTLFGRTECGPFTVRAARVIARFDRDVTRRKATRRAARVGSMFWRQTLGHGAAATAVGRRARLLFF